MHTHTEPHCDTGHGAVPEFSQVVSLRTDDAVIEKLVVNLQHRIVALGITF
jgi:hypothetical protein